MSCVYAQEKPLISIITSVYKSEKFMRSFLEDITQQTIFNQCELILINANSPENEEAIIHEFQKTFSNITYLKLDVDPGLYGVWNRALAFANGEFITNANTDDRLHPECYQTYISYLINHSEIDLVYADYYLTYDLPLYTFSKLSSEKIACASRSPIYSFELLKRYCFIGPQPMWRKSMHTRYGVFNDSYAIAGDWEMWLRAACFGAKFAKIPQVLGLFYVNPEGLSNCKARSAQIRYEERVVRNCYGSRTIKRKI